MTREEEIVNAAKEHEMGTEFGELVKSPLSRGVNSAYGIGFIEGCVWADQHPIDVKIKETLLAYTKWLDKRGFFKEDLQCDFLHQIETFLEMKGGDK